jgi:hypothetical protein
MLTLLLGGTVCLEQQNCWPALLRSLPAGEKINKYERDLKAQMRQNYSNFLG